MFNKITGINESKTLTKVICNLDQSWNNNKCQFKCRKRHVCGKDHIWNPATCSCEYEKYLVSIMDDSAVMCDKVIELYDKDVEVVRQNKNYSNKF